MKDVERGATGLAGQLVEAAELAPDDLGSTLTEVRQRARRRMRNRRAAVAGAAVAVAAVVGTTVVTAPWAGGAAPDGAAGFPAAGPAAVPGRAVTGTTPGPGTAAPGSDPAATEAPPAEDPWGAVIRTPDDYEGGKLALWFSRPAAGSDGMQLSLGSRDTGGVLRSFGHALPLEGEPGPTAGFGPGYAANSRTPRAYALFGWVVGDDVARVTLTVDGEPKVADVAPWSEDPRVHAWWVLGPRLAEWPATSEGLRGVAEDVIAYDSAGGVVARSANGNISRG